MRKITPEEWRAIDAILDEHETLDDATKERLSAIVVTGLAQTPKKKSGDSPKS